MCIELEISGSGYQSVDLTSPGAYELSLDQIVSEHALRLSDESRDRQRVLPRHMCIQGIAGYGHTAPGAGMALKGVHEVAAELLGADPLAEFTHNSPDVLGILERGESDCQSVGQNAVDEAQAVNRQRFACLLSGMKSD